MMILIIHDRCLYCIIVQCLMPLILYNNYKEMYLSKLTVHVEELLQLRFSRRVLCTVAKMIDKQPEKLETKSTRVTSEEHKRKSAHVTGEEHRHKSTRVRNEEHKRNFTRVTSEERKQKSSLVAGEEHTRESNLHVLEMKNINTNLHVLELRTYT